MTKNDAAKILELNGDITPEIVKKAYKKASLKFHPDKGGSLEMMKSVNLAYDTLKDLTENVAGTTSGKDGEAYNYAEHLNDAINAVCGVPELQLEICGAWLWVSGSTKEHKDLLKSNGFLWAPKKKQWYFRPKDWKSRSRGKFSMDDIRNMHGSQSVNTQRKERIAC